MRLGDGALLIGADRDVGDAVAGDVAGARPESEARERGRSREGDDRDVERWRAQIEGAARFGERAQRGAADHDGERARARSIGGGAEVLASDQEIAEPVAGDVVDPDRAAGHLRRAVAEDREETRARERRCRACR